ncbi:MAG: 30S ribosomal protein S18 [Verrucomicrobiota bacterium]|jgi:small subunit ribosomal protein S18|nr:30S ribosomal protein S18 [Verrucomicrobiota bacterium]
MMKDKKKRAPRRDNNSLLDDAGRKRVRMLKADQQVDYRDYEFLRKFMTERGKILPGRVTGANAKQQRQVKRAIRRARVMGLLP